MAEPTYSSREQLHEMILDLAMQEFIARGIRAVKMDDLAQQMGISKRTIYEIFENKEEMLFECVNRAMTQQSQRIMAMLAQSDNVIDFIVSFYRLKIEESQKVSTDFYTDLMRYPRVNELLRSEQSHVREMRERLFLRGVKEGYFRADLDFELVSTTMEELTMTAAQKLFYKKFGIHELFRNLFLIIIRGICTQKGVERLDLQFSHL